MSWSYRPSRRKNSKQPPPTTTTPMNDAPTYAMSENLLQSIVSALGEMPARATRGLLNAIEAEIVRQDRERAEQRQAEQRAALRAEIEQATRGPAA